MSQVLQDDIRVRTHFQDPVEVVQIVSVDVLESLSETCKTVAFREDHHICVDRVCFLETSLHLLFCEILCFKLTGLFRGEENNFIAALAPRVHNRIAGVVQVGRLDHHNAQDSDFVV